MSDEDQSGQGDPPNTKPEGSSAASGGPQTPAGWYNDPIHEGQFRFWDGTGWTEQRLDHDPSQTPQPGESPAGWYYDPLRVDTYRRWNGTDWTETHASEVPAKPQSLLADVPTGSKKKALLIAGVIAAVVVLLGALAFVVTRIAGGGAELRGTAMLIDSDIRGDLTDCRGTGGYSDFGEGQDVKVRNSEGNLIGSGTTRNATRTELLDYLTINEDAGTREDAEDFLDTAEGVTCIVVFDVDVEDSDFYEIEVGRRGELSYSKEELEEANWYVSTSLGGFD